MKAGDLIRFRDEPTLGFTSSFYKIARILSTEGTFDLIVEVDETKKDDFIFGWAFEDKPDVFVIYGLKKDKKYRFVDSKLGIIIKKSNNLLNNE
jgi:hypothetical protein